MIFCGKMLRVFTYQEPCHNDSHHVDAPDLKLFWNPSRDYQIPHYGKIGAKPNIKSWVRNIYITNFAKFISRFSR